MRGMAGGVSSPQLAGRAEELQRLMAALGRVQELEAAGFVVGGESGIGKTRLLREFAAAAEGSGARVLWGSAPSTAQSSVAFAPVSAALRPLTREFTGPMLDWVAGDGRMDLAMLVPEFAKDGEDRVAEASSELGQQRLFARVLELLERLAGEQPVVLVVEDLHWADRSTRQLLSFLTRNLRGVPVLLVGTYRTENLSSGDALRGFLLELDHSGIVERIELKRLRSDEVRSLLEGVLGVPPATDVCDEIVARSDGNPFFAEELLDAMRRGDGRALPPTLRDLLLHRVELLDADARQVLSIAAVIGRTFDHRLLAEVAGLGEDALLAGIRDCIAHQLVVPQADGQSYAFRHALTQEAVYTALAVGDRLRLHASVARTMAERADLVGKGTAAALAHHWDASADARRALAAHVEAGRAAEQVYGFAEARQHFSRAAELWRRVPDAAADLGCDRIDLLDRAAAAAMLTGDEAGAAVLLAEAVAAAEPLRACMLRERLGTAYRLAGNEDLGIEEIRTALERLPADAPPEARARLIAANSTACLATGSLEESRIGCERAIALAQQHGAREIEAYAQITLGPVLVLLGEVEESLAHVRRGRAIAEETNDLENLFRADVNISFCFVIAGLYADAVEDLDAAIARTARAGLTRAYGAAPFLNRGEALWRLGRWDEAEEDNHRGLAWNPDGGAATDAYATLAVIAAARGRWDDADRALEAARRTGDPGEYGALAVAEMSLWRGDPEAAAAAVADSLYDWDGPRRHPSPDLLGWLFWLAIRAEADRVEVALALRHKDAVAAGQDRASVLRNRTRMIQTPLRPAAAYRALCEAEWTRAQQKPDADAWAAAAELWDSLDEAYLGAYARWRQAEALADAHAGAAATSGPLLAAHAAAAAMGAIPLRDAIELLAVRARVSLVPVQPPTVRDTGGPAAALGLTPRETDVLQLVAEGRTNQEIGEALFISAKTASVHVTNILRKLDVPNRGHAAAVAHRLGLTVGGS